MHAGLSIAVVVPARDEAERLGAVLSGMPALVDAVYVVDDGSRDTTASVALAGGAIVLRHPRNRGVGAAIRSGYLSAAADGHDVAVVMAGDNQMHPADLPALLAPLESGAADYVKGNRFLHRERRNMPAARRLAGRALALATRAATGYRIDDSQCGYTALRLATLPQLNLGELWPRYGYPNDLLVLAARARLRVSEVPVKPVYAGEHSGVRPWHALLILSLLARRAWANKR